MKKTTLPSSVLKKKHKACNYHLVRKAVAAKIIEFGHIDTDDNMTDIYTKPLPGLQFTKLTSKCLFHKPQAFVETTTKE